MANRTAEQWHAEVQDAIRSYRHAGELEQQAAGDWRQVQQVRALGLDDVTAIRGVLDQALEMLGSSQPEGAHLLREQYVGGRSIEAIAAELNFDPSSLHRRRNRMIKELAVIVAESNRRAERQARSERFRMRQPVVGFNALAAEVVARLVDHAGPLVVVLEGMGGLGKTTLARLIAERVAQDETFAGVLWTSAKQVDFDVWSGQTRPVQEHAVDPDMLLHELASELQLETPGDIASLRNEVRVHCKRAPYLIIFDNLETVADMAALAPLVDMLAGPSRVLITTRDRNFEALPATLARHYVVLDELDAVTSCRLLRDAAACTGAVALAGAPEVDLQRIYAVTGGNPLALWLVAGQARGIPWQTFIRDLVEYVPRGSTGYLVYDYLYRRSWEQLSAEARLALFAMHRCEDGADPDLLRELSALDRPTFDLAVEELHNRMLLTFDGRYRVHRLTYTFLRVVIAGWWD